MSCRKCLISMVTVLAIAALASACGGVSRPGGTPPAPEPDSGTAAPSAGGARTPGITDTNRQATESVSSADTAVPITTLDRGSYSGVTERKALLIADPAAWSAHWQRHVSGQVPAPAGPAIDFSREAILAVHMGKQRSGGYGVEVTEVRAEPGKLAVTVRQTLPGPDALVTAALTQPFHVVKIPRVEVGTPLEVSWK